MYKAFTFSAPTRPKQFVATSPAVEEPVAQPAATTRLEKVLEAQDAPDPPPVQRRMGFLPWTKMDTFWVMLTLFFLVFVVVFVCAGTPVD
jgi:hypothetical protein